jgi:hypothetical protein
MKKWFAADYRQWQTAARVALDISESDPPFEEVFPDLVSSRRTAPRGVGKVRVTNSLQAVPVPVAPETSNKLTAAPPETQLPPPVDAKHKRRNLIIIASGMAAGALCLVGGIVLSTLAKPTLAPVPVQARPLPPKVEALPIESPQVNSDIDREATQEPTMATASPQPTKRARKSRVAQTKRHPAGHPRIRKPVEQPPARPNPF